MMEEQALQILRNMAGDDGARTVLKSFVLVCSLAQVAMKGVPHHDEATALVNEIGKLADTIIAEHPTARVQ